MADEIDALSKREAWAAIVDQVFDQVITPIETRTSHVSRGQIELARTSAKLPRVKGVDGPEVVDPASLFDRLQRELERRGLEIVRSQR